MNIEYKRLETSDYDFVTRLISENLGDVIAQSFNGYFNIALFFDRAMHTGNSYIIFYNGSQCGFLWHSVKDGCLNVNTIVIDREYQSKGIGSYVFDEIEKKVREINIRCIQLGVQSVNTRAKNFYAGRGFKEIGYMKEFDTIYMEKRL